MTPTNNRLPIILFFFISLSSCYKQSSEIISNEDQFLSKAKAYFNQHISQAGSNQGYNIDSKNPRKDLPKKPDWNKAKRIKFSGTDAFVVPVVYEQPFVILSNFSGKRAYSVNDITKLLIYKDNENQYQFELITYFPDKNYKKEKFSGLLFVENWQGVLLNEFKYESGRRVKKLDIERQRKASNQNNSDDIIPNTVITVCYEISGYNYTPSTGEYTYWSYAAGCDSYFIDDSPSSGGNSDDEYLEPIGGGGGGGGEGGFTPEEIVVIEQGIDPITNIVDYNKCYTNVAGAGNEYKVKLCIQQPEPGSRETWGFGQNPSGNPFIVGHAFLVLTQNTPTGDITRNIGYYPASGVTPWTPSASGQLNNDANRGYNISLEISMTNSQFFNILDFIAQANNPAFQYNMNTNNCAHFVLNALSSAGINLPRTSGMWLNGSGLNPGDLGEDIRTMQLGSNMTRSASNNYHPNMGTCY